jgi:transcriptional regulator of met regulon
MKLYTEEQVKQIVEKSRETGLTAEYLMLVNTPIELPTDEEIGKGRDENIPIDEKDMWSERFYFTLGAKWMRDKIQGGNK